MFIGELSLSGEIRRVSGILPCAICAKENNIKRIETPTGTAKAQIKFCFPKIYVAGK